MIAPAALTTIRMTRKASLRVLVETSALGIRLHRRHRTDFRSSLWSRPGLHPLEYFIFPFVIAAAVRNGQPATALVVVGASFVTIWNTTHQTGPFAGVALHQGLILLQVFTGVLAGTGLLLAAAMSEQKLEIGVARPSMPSAKCWRALRISSLRRRTSSGRFARSWTGLLARCGSSIPACSDCGA